MPSLLTTPTSVAGAVWTSGSGVIGTRYLNTTGGDETWLQFAFTIALNASATIIGAEVNFYADDNQSGSPTLSYPLEPNVETVDAALTLAIGTITGTQIRNTGAMTASYNIPIYVSLGGVTDQWGQTLTPAFFNSSNFVLAVRRGTQAHEVTSTARAIQAPVLTIYYLLPGGSMATRTTVTQKVFIGKEATPGTLASSFTRLVGIETQINPKMVTKEYRGAGEKLPIGTAVMNEGTELPVSGSPNFNEIGFFLASLLQSDAAVMLIPGSATGYRHSFRSNSRANDVISNYSVIFGDTVRAQSATFGQITDLQLNATGNDLTISGNGMGRPFSDSATIPTGATDVQTMTFGGTVTGGSFYLRFAGQDTAAIAWSATPATLATNISAGLIALGNIGAAGVVVSGTGPFTVTFSGAALAGQKQQLIELTPVTGNALTGTAPTVTIVHTTVGGWVELPFVPIEPDQLNVYMSTTYSTLAASQMTNVFVANIHAQAKAKPYFTLNRTNAGGMAGMAEDKTFAIAVKLTAQADGTAMPLLTSLRQNQLVYLRFEFISPVLCDGTNPYRLVFDLACYVSNFEPFGDEDGVYAANFTLTTSFDSPQGYSSVVTLDNAVAAY